MCCSAFAQSSLSELDKVKGIKLLESNRDNVRKILGDYESDDSDYDDYRQNFSTDNVHIVVTFSKGDCSDSSAYWNVAEWVATKVKITPQETIKSSDFNFSNFTKETPDEESPETYNYLDENSGIVFEVDDEEIQRIILYPPKNQNGFLCSNENTEQVYSSHKRMVDLMLEEPVCVLINRPADVTDLLLSADEITISCGNSTKTEKCRDTKTRTGETRRNN